MAPTAVTTAVPASKLPVAPWSSVLPLAVVAAFGNGFWLIAMRGAVGPIERTSGPFEAWLQESTLLLPVYVFVVLAALTLARRWFGPHPSTARTVTLTVLLVVLASTLAGTAVEAANAVYDYRLQDAHLAALSSHGCDTDCLTTRQDSALLLQVRALGLGALLMLVSNLLLLGLVVAFRGGRLDLASTPRNRLRASDPNGPARGRESFLVAGLLGAAAIHATVVDDHLAEWPAAGIFFLVLTALQLAAAVFLLVRLRLAVVFASLVSAGPILVWLYSRTSGLPFGPAAGAREPIGLTDLAALLLEVGTLTLALAILRSRQRPHQLDAAPHRRRLTLTAVVAITVVGVAGGLGLLGAGHQTPTPPAPSTQHHTT